MPARSKLWAVPVSYTGWPDDVKAADRKAAKTVQEKVSDPGANKLNKTYWESRLKIAPGDWVI